MDKKRLRKMRIKQVSVINTLIIVFIIIFFTFVGGLEITQSQFFLILGIIILAQTLVRWFKRKSTKSIIPVFEQVATYEKQKMGKEWKKQYNTGTISNLFLSGIFLLQAYLFTGVNDRGIHIDKGFMLVTFLISAVIINVALYFHIRKVDQSHTASEFKGYTLKSYLIGAAGGVALTFIFFTGLIFYVLTFR
ncbi:hypothetical protein SAMN05216238_10162 [Lentibacillus persicus]|uniref:Uncharacterized protein n=1 Tax=Lentibacillus persicus TaxID=640948 RepID=A0A1I1RUU2_9BACI|nr:hypothetical protein [Lentibacillus persicus]SFD37887.1 hypothetical protein SAMN05216238_10162 [Lentibacillus persicus]